MLRIQKRWRLPCTRPRRNAPGSWIRSRHRYALDLKGRCLSPGCADRLRTHPRPTGHTEQGRSLPLPIALFKQRAPLSSNIIQQHPFLGSSADSSFGFPFVLFALLRGQFDPAARTRRTWTQAVESSVCRPPSALGEGTLYLEGTVGTGAVASTSLCRQKSSGKHEPRDRYEVDT